MDSSNSIVVFAYNFPHRKTQDILVYLSVLGYRIQAVLAADPVKLNIPASSIRTKLRHHVFLHPKEIAAAMGAPYYVVAHNSPEAEAYLKGNPAKLGIIAGARILTEPIIRLFDKGIINFHPGLLPEVRGLDAMAWSILNEIPLGVTAHLIDSKIDAGLGLIRKPIDIYKDDSLFDLSERLYETQLAILAEAIELAVSEKTWPIETKAGSYNRKMKAELEQEVLKRSPFYIKQFAKP